MSQEAKENPIEAPKEQKPPAEPKAKRVAKKKAAKTVSVWAKTVVIKGYGKCNVGDVVTDDQRKFFDAQINKNYDPKSGSDKPSIDAFIKQV